MSPKYESLVRKEDINVFRNYVAEFKRNESRSQRAGLFVKIAVAGVLTLGIAKWGEALDGAINDSNSQKPLFYTAKK